MFGCFLFHKTTGNFRTPTSPNNFRSSSFGPLRPDGLWKVPLPLFQVKLCGQGSLMKYSSCGMWIYFFAFCECYSSLVFIGIFVRGLIVKAIIGSIACTPPKTNIDRNNKGVQYQSPFPGFRHASILFSRGPFSGARRFFWGCSLGLKNHRPSTRSWHVLPGNKQMFVC